MFVVLEGLSGCGKSTVASLLEEEGWCRVSPPHPSLHDARRIVDADPDALEARHLLFLTGLSLDSIEVKRHLTAGRRVVADSWVYRTTATHTVLGSRVGYIALPWLPEPDYAFFLDCPEDIRRSRRQTRGQTDPLWKAETEIRSDQVKRFFSERYPHIRTIDASGTPETIIATIKKSIEI